MKKIKILIVVSLVLAISLMSYWSCERSRLLRGLDGKARKLDVMFETEKHDGPDELMQALGSYLNETAFVLNARGLMVGSHLTARQRQVVFENADQRLLKAKNALLTHPSLFATQPPDLDLMVDRFFEKVGTRAHLNKDQELMAMLNRWTSSGNRARLYISKDEKNQYYRQASDAFALEQEKERQTKLARKQVEPAPKLEIPGLEDVQNLKQREFTRVSHIQVPFEQLHRYLGDKLIFIMKNGHQLRGECAEFDGQTLHIGFHVEGNYFLKKVDREEIAKIEKFSVEKGLETYDPAKETAALGPAFKEMEILGHPHGAEHMGFITTGDRMYFVSRATGALVAHSQKNREGYRPMATRIHANWDRDFYVARVDKKPGGRSIFSKPGDLIELSECAWNNPLYCSAANFGNYDVRSRKSDKAFLFQFEVRLVKKMPGRSSPIVIYCKDVLLNPTTIRVMFNARRVDTAIQGVGNPKYGKGELPWEYVLVSR